MTEPSCASAGAASFCTRPARGMRQRESPDCSGIHRGRSAGARSKGYGGRRRHYEAVLERTSPTRDVAVLAAQLARALAFAGEFERSVAPTSWRSRCRRARRLPEPLASALRTKALLTRRSRQAGGGARARPACAPVRARERSRASRRCRLVRGALGSPAARVTATERRSRRSAKRSSSLDAAASAQDSSCSHSARPRIALTMTGRWDEASR